LDKERPPSWSKILAVRKSLPHYDWVFWNDAVCVCFSLGLVCLSQIRERTPIHVARGPKHNPLTQRCLTRLNNRERPASRDLPCKTPFFRALTRQLWKASLLKIPPALQLLWDFSYTVHRNWSSYDRPLLEQRILRSGRVQGLIWSPWGGGRPRQPCSPSER